MGVRTCGSLVCSLSADVPNDGQQKGVISLSCVGVAAAGRQSGAQPAPERPPRRSGSVTGESAPRRESRESGAPPGAPNQAAGAPRPSQDPPENGGRRPSGSGAPPGERRPSAYPAVYGAGSESNGYPAPVHYPAVTGESAHATSFTPAFLTY